MKYILLITIILNTLVLATSEVVLGTYSSTTSAINVKIKIDKIISDDFRFRDFLIKNSIKSMVREKGNYFIVALGPINDIVTQHSILNRVKKTSFKDAYALQISEHKDLELLLEDKPNIDNIDAKPVKIAVIKTPHKVQTQAQKAYSQANMLNEYFNEIIATISILLLSIIYLMIKKRQHTNNQYSDLKIKNKDEILEINDSYEYKDEFSDDDVYEMQGNNEIIFDALDDSSSKKVKVEESIEEIVVNSPKDIQEIIPTKTTSNVAKKQVPRHEKITKADFKNFAGVRIMIAEDNIINQKVINGLLSDSNIDIVIVDDGREVLDFLEKDNDFSIILMDAHMPNMDGYEATRRIRANPQYSHITVVALSGDTASDDIKNMKNAGMQEHLEKPLKMDPLYDLLYSYSKIQDNYETLENALYKEIGLEVCGGDESFYKEILNDFVSDNIESTNELKKLLDDKEFTKAQEFLLDLVGVTANIGASRVQKIALELKASLDNPDDHKYLDIFKDYDKNYKHLESEVKEYL